MLRASTAALTVGGLLIGLAALVASATAQSGPAIGIDASPAGNTATTLGEADSCIAVSKGDSFQVDVYASNVKDLLAWEAYLFFDKDLLRVTTRDVKLLQAAPKGSSVFDASESVPDDDGRYRIGAADISDPPAPASGSGVLARLTLEALAPGTAKLSIAPVETDIGTVGPFLRDVEGNVIADADENGFFDGPFADADVRIDGDCPGGGAPAVLETPSATPGGGSGGGGGSSDTTLWIGLGVGAAAVVTVGGLGAYMWSRRRSALAAAPDSPPDVMP